MGLQMRLKHGQLGLLEFAVAPAVGQVQQARQTTLPIALEVVAHRIGVDQQGLGDIFRRAPARQQDHGLDAVGLALVARTPVRGTQLGEFRGWKAVIDHAGDDKTTSVGYARLLRENLR